MKNKQATIIKIVVVTALSIILLATSLRYDMRLFYVTTGSMIPVIPTRSLVLTMHSNIFAFIPGQLIVFNDQVNKHIVAHRVTAVTADFQYVTKGDANDYQDRYKVLPSDILGKVIAVFPVTNPRIIILHSATLLIVYLLGVLVRRFLILLSKYVSTAFSRVYFFRGSKKTFYSRPEISSLG